MLTSLRRAGTLGEPAGANKAILLDIAASSPDGHDAAAIFASVPLAAISLDISKSFTPIGDRLTTIPQRAGIAGAKSVLMNFAPVFAASRAPSPDARLDKAMRLYLLRSLLSPIVSTRWARFIHSYHHAFEAGPPPSRVLLKPVRSYVHVRLGPTARFDLLRDHYRLFRQLFSPACVRRVCAGEPIVVAELAARKGGVYCVAVSAATRVSMQREGEMAIFLIKRGAQEPVSKLAFAFGRVDGQLAILIGGLQGPSTGHKRDVIDATRELRGLRPKDATLLAVRALAKAVGATSVHAIANRNHVLDRLSGASRHADYDAYWRERGATPGGPLGFVFPPLDEIVAAGAGRDALKAAIAAAMQRFAVAYARPVEVRSLR